MPSLLFDVAREKNLNKVFIIFCLCGFGYTPLSFASETTKLETKKMTENISQEFLDFAAEFSDDDDGMLELLAEDADGHLMYEETGKPIPTTNASEPTASSEQSLKMKRRFRQNSSTSSSNVGGEKQ